MSDDKPASLPGDDANAGGQDKDHQRAVGSFVKADFMTAIGTMALAAVAILTLTGIRLQAALVLLTFMLPLVLGRRLFVLRKDRHLPLLISLFAGLLAVSSFGWWDSYSGQHKTGGAGKPSPGQGTKISDSPLPAVNSGISFLDPQPGDHVKQCPRIDGVGAIPPGDGLWIIVVPDVSTVPRSYWIEAQAKSDGPDHWTAADSVSIGNPSTNGINADIYAVLVDKKWSDYFGVSTAEGTLSATSLPPTSAAGTIGPVTITRVAGTGSCH
jgi:hypothetical protein